MKRNNGNSQTKRALFTHQGLTDVCTRTLLTFAILCLGAAAEAYGQTTDPWSTAAGQLATAFTGPIAKGFSLVAIVLGGLELGFGNGSNRHIGALIFGVGLALGAATFLGWIIS